MSQKTPVARAVASSSVLGRGRSLPLARATAVVGSLALSLSCLLAPPAAGAPQGDRSPAASVASAADASLSDGATLAGSVVRSAPGAWAAVASAPSARKQPARLTSSGLGPLRLGMTLSQARRADPSLRVVRNGNGQCVYASTALAKQVVFNPSRFGGRLAFIVPRSGIKTATGLGVGDTHAKAKSAYKFKRTQVSVVEWDFIAIGSNYLKMRGAEARPGQFPKLGIHFTERTAGFDDETVDIRRERVKEFHLDGGQQCFS